VIETERLILRRYLPADRAALHAMWADPAVMRDLGRCKSPEDSDATIARHLGYGESHGLGFWVVERCQDGAVTGFCGLKPGAPDTPIEGELEIGWMFARPFWGQGYAREAAAASLAWGWANRTEPRIVAITAATNAASRTLMDRLGMTWFANFEHPLFAPGDQLGDTVAYAVARP
jgi:RimJ/RimL family protein N-acetyltransferase